MPLVTGLCYVMGNFLVHKQSKDLFLQYILQYQGFIMADHADLQANLDFLKAKFILLCTNAHMHL